jgi:hypothetical protein
VLAECAFLGFCARPPARLRACVLIDSHALWLCRDPYLTAEYAMHWIRGMQFGIPGSPTYDPSTLKVAATAKHFSNYGNLDCLHVWLHVAQRIHNNKPP